ncbi:MAG TPA: protein kinase [Chitinispirillaceae bacterium]|nr:protein kinase [Chitinispirillaceae bacterium]
MDQKENQNIPPPDEEWLKTISDAPISDLKKKSTPVFKSPYAVPEMPLEVKIGDVLGSGKILDVLGEGGFARVYKIHDQKLDLYRAVKVLLPTGKKEVSDRFLTEARITARLDHPNIVKVFRVDEWNRCPFIEMEFIDGKSLETLLEECGNFPVYAACAVGIYIAQALKYAHNLDFTLSDKQYKGVIHRDLKPANIMLHHDGRLKLMDFGIARPISTGLHTMGENIVGTLQYLSPEQLNHKNIDQRTDIYAVGAILYELLCGIKAFPDEGLTDLVNKKASGIYKPFGEFPISVPKKMTEIVDRCLQVDKEERYPSASELSDALNIAYAQYASVLPDIALKNFIQNPDYTPILTKVVKKKRSHSPRTVPKWHWPEMPKIRHPRFSWPRIPHFHLPEIPRLQLPKEQFQKLGQIILNKINGAFKAVIWQLIQIWKIPHRVATFAAASIRRIPKGAYAIASAVCGGIIFIVFLTFFVLNQSKERTNNFAEKRDTFDTASIFAFNTPLLTDTVKVKTIKPEVFSPGADEIIQSETLNVRWHLIPEVDSYTVQIDTTGRFPDTVYLQTVSTDTFCQISDIGPGFYHFRVGISGKDSKLCWSSSRLFNFSPVYHTPRLIVPSNEDTCTDREITFQWRKVAKARSYHIVVSADSNFKQLLIDSIGCRDTFFTHIFFDTSTTYFWRVRTKVSSDWSPTNTFTISDSNDYCADAASALRRGRLSSVEKSLQKIAPEDSCRDTIAIRLAEVYLKKLKYENARIILSGLTIQDMLADYIKSSILISEGNYAVALNILDTAIHLKTLFPTWEDSSKVYYLRAVAAQKIYDDKKDTKNGKKAYYAWGDVVLRYNSQQSHDHYKEALVKMNQLYHTDKIFRSANDTLKKQPPNSDLQGDSPNKSKKNRWFRKVKPL